LERNRRFICFSQKDRHLLPLLMLALAALACTFGFEPTEPGQTSAPLTNPDTSGSDGADETGRVTQIVDGDTIEVEIDGVGYRVRYVGVNTPERDEDCYQEAVDANAALVRGQTVRLVRDESNTDRFGRLLRYVYVGSTFVNEALVRDGWAEAVEYRPDTRHTADFRALEQTASSANRGCHPTGIFDDGSLTR
jgi:endonuclease YncB( thermonuclease family)